MSRADISPFRALDHRASIWVGANAGSGKTYILVSRLVRLMLEGEAPEKLLCLTYTRAAAAEMQDRLFSLLGEWALMDDAALRAAIAQRLGPNVGSDNLARARTLFAQALETPGGLKIQTIHAFCESLLKRFPLEAQLSPQFDLMDEHEAQDIQFQLIFALMRRPVGDALHPAMERLARVLNEPDLVQLGRAILAHREAFATLDKASYLPALAKGMKLPVKLPTRHGLIEALTRKLSPEAARLSAWLAEGSKTDKQRGLDFKNWAIAAQQDGVAAWPRLQHIFLTGGKIRDRLATKARQEAAPELARRITQCAARVERTNDRLNALASYHLTAALLDFAAALIAAYQHRKQALELLDYDDLIAITNRLLSGAGAAQWVLFKIDSGLTHILVDEAQDTSAAQWRVIRALADAFFADAGASNDDTPRTIFAVGDEKQSIFSFQGADPAGFAEQYAHFKKAAHAVGAKMHYVPLTVSRRSVDAILQLVDRVFAVDANRHGVSAGDAPISHTAHRVGETGHVELWPVEKTPRDKQQVALWDIPDATDGRDGAGRLAARIGDKIRTLLDDAAQNVSAGDILILVRKRDGFVDEMMRALKRRDIPVAGADRMVLLDQIAIMDVLAAADFALNADDDLTLACVLRSPLCDLCEDQLFALAHNRQGSLWQAVEASWRTTTDEKLAQAYQRLVWMRARIDFLSPFDWFAELLSAQGAQGLLSARLGPEIDDPVGELLRLALAYESRHVASMQGFLHWLRGGQQEIKRDMEGRGGVVRIMTVHGAKGLEAPIVFLPDTCRPPIKTGGGAMPLQFDTHGKPLWRAAKLVREAYGAAQIEAADELAGQEERRLLYVALTRARDRLYIGGYLGRRSQNLPEGCWYGMLAGAFGASPEAADIAVWPSGAEVGLPQDAAHDAPVPPVAPPVAPPVGPPVGAPPDWVRRNPPAPPAAPIAYFGDKLFAPSRLAHRAASSSLPAPSPEASSLLEGGGDDMAAAQRGHLIHKLLETLPGVPRPARRDAAQAYLGRQKSGLADDVLQALCDEALAVMDRPEWVPLFSAAARAEAPIAGFLTLHSGDRLAMSGQIDRYLELPDAIWLVDFKTGRRSDAAMGAYGVQMAAYRALMQAAKPAKPVRCGIIWTQNPSLDWFDDEILRAALEDILSGARKLT